MVHSSESAKRGVFAPWKLARATDQGSSFLAFLGAGLPAHHPGWRVRGSAPCPGTLSSSQASRHPLPLASAPQTTCRTTCSSQTQLYSASVLSTADVQAQTVSSPRWNGGIVILSDQQPHGTGARAPPLDRGAPSLCPSCTLPCPGDPAQGVEWQGKRLNGPFWKGSPAVPPGTRGRSAPGSEGGTAPGPSLASSSTRGMLRLWKQARPRPQHTSGEAQGTGRHLEFSDAALGQPFPNFPAISSYSASRLSCPTWQGEVAGGQ